MILYIFIIAHLLADFTFQTTAMAEKKKKDFKALFKRSFIYFLVSTIIALVFVQPFWAFCVMSIISISHFFINCIRISIEKRFNSQTLVFGVFVGNQILHLAIIIVTTNLLAMNDHCNNIYISLSQHDLFNKMVLYILLFVLVLDPAAVFIKKLFGLISKETENSKDDPRIGNIIGKLERLMTVSLVLCGKYDAVGLILAAKSIARFKQMDNRGFAEKYLVGTLTSLSIALIAAILVNFLVTQL